MEATLGSKIVPRMITVPEVIQRANALGLNMMEDILIMLMHNMDQRPQISWIELFMLRDKDRATDYLSLLLQVNATVTEPAVGKLLGSFDVDTVRMVL
jgi:hypothetical protein